MPKKASLESLLEQREALKKKLSDLDTAIAAAQAAQAQARAAELFSLIKKAGLADLPTAEIERRLLAARSQPEAGNQDPPGEARAVPSETIDDL